MPALPRPAQAGLASHCLTCPAEPGPHPAWPQRASTSLALPCLPHQAPPRLATPRVNTPPWTRRTSPDQACRFWPRLTTSRQASPICASTAALSPRLALTSQPSPVRPGRAAACLVRPGPACLIASGRDPPSLTSSIHACLARPRRAAPHPARLRLAQPRLNMTRLACRDAATSARAPSRPVSPSPACRDLGRFLRCRDSFHARDLGQQGINLPR